MVEASPSTLFDSTLQEAFGLPSIIHDGSIGRGVKSTVNLAISISARDIENLKYLERFGNPGFQANGRRLNFPYELRRNRRQRHGLYANCGRESRSYAHSPLRNSGTRRPSAKTPSISVLSEPIIQS